MAGVGGPRGPTDSCLNFDIKAFLCESQGNITSAVAQDATKCLGNTEVRVYKFIGEYTRGIPSRGTLGQVPSRPDFKSTTGVTTEDILWNFFSTRLQPCMMNSINENKYVGVNLSVAAKHRMREILPVDPAATSSFDSFRRRSNLLCQVAKLAGISRIQPGNPDRIRTRPEMLGEIPPPLQSAPARIGAEL